MRLLSALVAAVLVLPTLAVTAAGLVRVDTLLWVVLRASGPLAILPYTLAVALLLALPWGLRGPARTISLSALVLVMSLLVVHVWWFTAPSRADERGATTAHALVVMTTNLHFGEAEPDDVLDVVDEEDVDVLVLEEITPSALTRLERSGIDRRLPHRAGTAETGRDGVMVFSRAPSEDVATIRTRSPGLVVRTETDQGPLRILAVHPTAPTNGVGRWSDDLDVVVAAARESEGPTVLAGDFNATVDHPQLRELLAAGYRDAGAGDVLSWRPTWPSSDEAGDALVAIPPLFALDHVFVRDRLTVTEARTHPVRGTDHRAVVSRISWTDG